MKEPKMPKRPLCDNELVYAVTSRCPCGAGIAHWVKAAPFGDTAYWDCSDILTERATPSGEEGSVQHTARLPFMFYEIKSEKQPSAAGATTRPSGAGVTVQMADRTDDPMTQTKYQGYEDTIRRALDKAVTGFQVDNLDRMAALRNEARDALDALAAEVARETALNERLRAARRGMRDALFEWLTVQGYNALDAAEIVSVIDANGVAVDALAVTDKEALAEVERYKTALERIASGESFTATPGIIDRSFSGLQAQGMMEVAREALAGVEEEA